MANKINKKGITINGSFKEVLFVVFVVLMLVVAPIFLNENSENISSALNSASQTYQGNPYGASTGQVAGINTISETNANTGTFTVPFTNNKIVLNVDDSTKRTLLITSVIFFSISAFMIVYLVSSSKKLSN